MCSQARSCCVLNAKAGRGDLRRTGTAKTLAIPVVHLLPILGRRGDDLLQPTRLSRRRGRSAVAQSENKRCLALEGVDVVVARSPASHGDGECEAWHCQNTMIASTGMKSLVFGWSPVGHQCQIGSVESARSPPPCLARWTRYSSICTQSDACLQLGSRMVKSG